MRKILALTAILSVGLAVNGQAQAPLPGPFQQMMQPAAPVANPYGSAENANIPQAGQVQPYWSQAPAQQLPYWMQRQQQQTYSGNNFAGNNAGNGNGMMNSQTNGQAQTGMNFGAMSQGQNGFNQGFGNTAAPGYFPGFAAVSNGPANNTQPQSNQYAPQAANTQGNPPMQFQSNQFQGNPFQNGQNWNGNGPWNQNWGNNQNFGNNQNYNNGAWGFPNFGNWGPSWGNFGSNYAPSNQQGYGPSVGR